MNNWCVNGGACGCGAKIVEVKGGVREHTYEITESGHYVLKGDVSFEPLVGGTASCCFPAYEFACNNDGNTPCAAPCGPGDETAVLAIKISASNVTLDLGGFELSQGNALPYVRGVQIERGVQNVRILNGVIRGFSQWALRVRGDVSNVSVEKVMMTQCGFNNPETLSRFASAMGAVALGESRYFDMGGADDLVLRVLENVYFDAVRVVGNYFMGLFVGRVKGLQVKDSNFDDTYRKVEEATRENSDRLALYCYPMTIGVGGFDRAAGETNAIERDFVTEHVSFRGCTFNGATNETPPPEGPFISRYAAARCEIANGHDLLFEKCEWRNYFALGGQSTAVDHDGVDSISFVDCLVSDMESKYSFAEGFHLSGTIDRQELAFPPQTTAVIATCDAVAFNGNVQISGCTIRRLRGTGGARTSGIFTWGKNISIKNTIIEDVVAEQDIAAGINVFSAGVPPNTDALNVEISGCQVSNIKGHHFTLGILLLADSAAFSPSPKIFRNVLLKNNYISGVTATGTPGVSNGDSYGIFILGESGNFTNFPGTYFVENPIVQDCQISDVRSTVLEGKFDESQALKMFRVKRPVVDNLTVVDCANGILMGETTDAVLSDNTVKNCTGIGYWDFATDASTALLLNNVAYRNGINYNITYASGALKLLTRASPGDTGVQSPGYLAGVDNISVN